MIFAILHINSQSVEICLLLLFCRHSIYLRRGQFPSQQCWLSQLCLFFFLNQMQPQFPVEKFSYKTVLKMEKHTESTDFVAQFCCASDGGIKFGVSGDPGWAAGSRGRPADQWCGGDASNEADTAQPPSSDALGPLALRVAPQISPHPYTSTPIHSTIQPTCLRFVGASNALLRHLFVNLLVGANTMFTLAKLGHSTQAKPLSTLFSHCLSLINAFVCVFQELPSWGKGEGKRSWWSVYELPTESGPWSEDGTVRTTPFSFFFFFLIYFFYILFSHIHKSICAQVLQTESGCKKKSNWKHPNFLRRRNTATAICDLAHFHFSPPLLLPLRRKNHGEEKDPDSEDYWWTQQTGQRQMNNSNLSVKQCPNKVTST